MPFPQSLEEERMNRRLERIHTDMAALQSLVSKGQWADPVCKTFAEYICEDLSDRIQNRKSHLTVIGKNTAANSDLKQRIDVNNQQREDREFQRSFDEERWHRAMLQLQSLVGDGNWEDESSKSFAVYLSEHLCEDLLRTIQDRKSLFTIINDNPASKSDSTQKFGVDKRELENDAQLSKQAICKIGSNSGKTQQLEDRSGRITNQIVVPKENAYDDGFIWRKYGSKLVRDAKYPWEYYRCASKECSAKKRMTQVDDMHFRIIYYELHNCGVSALSSGPGSSQPVVQQQGIGSDRNAALINETQQGSSTSHGYSIVQGEMTSLHPREGVIVNQMQVQQETHLLPDPPTVEHNVRLLKEIQKEHKCVNASSNRTSLSGQDLGPSVTNDCLSRSRTEDALPGEVQVSVSASHLWRGAICLTDSNSRKKNKCEGQTGRNTNNRTQHRVLFREAYADDGFKWRKYGQKEILGQPYPRHYYRCLRCTVKKSVQRVDSEYAEIRYSGDHSCRDYTLVDGPKLDVLGPEFYVLESTSAAPKSDVLESTSAAVVPEPECWSQGNPTRISSISQ